MLNEPFSHVVNVAVPKSHNLIVCFHQLAESLILQGETMPKHHSTDHIGDRVNDGEGRVNSSSCKHREALVTKTPAALLFWKQAHSEVLSQISPVLFISGAKITFPLCVTQTTRRVKTTTALPTTSVPYHLCSWRTPPSAGPRFVSHVPSLYSPFPVSGESQFQNVSDLSRWDHLKPGYLQPSRTNWMPC